MKTITFYLDFVSPYAWLAFEQLPRALQGLSYRVDYRPVLFAAFLKQHGQLGPAEIPAKRDWTYRHVQWLAQAAGVPLQLPAGHPFNPLALLRLALAAGTGGCANRYVCEAVFRHVWEGGASATDPARLVSLQAQLAPARAPDDAAVKAELKANTDGAVAQDAFGVPAFVVDDHLFWGLDALPMLRAYLDGHPWFADGHWERAAGWPAEVQRSR